MAKRAAENYLTHENYNDEDEEVVESGAFKQTSNAALGSREIKKAKRRIGVQDATSPAGGAFKTFAGFSANQSTGSPGFAFGDAGSKSFAPVPSVASTSAASMVDRSAARTTASLITSATPRAAAFSLGSGLSFVPDIASGGKKSAVKPASMSAPLAFTTSQASATSTAVTSTTTTAASNSGEQKSITAILATSGFHREMKRLNESVLQWIEQHVNAEPFCILSPVFADYNRFVEQLEKKYPVDASVPTTQSSSLQASVFSTASSSFTVATSSNSATTTSTSVPPVTSSGFHFGSMSTAPKFGSGLFGSTAGSSIFSAAAAPATVTGAFGFDAAAKQPAATTGEQQGLEDQQTTGDENEEYVPPKPEVVEIKEDDAFYTVKCKLFYKKDTIWQERGVGNLFLKPCAGNKTQLLIRADTNLGNILLNIVLNKTIPTSRQGVNNISMMCVPNPPIDTKNHSSTTPVCLLIRVKTTTAADELLQQLDSHKN